MDTHYQPSTVSQRIKTFNAPLLQDKVLLKYKILATDPFHFLRGTCHLFYEDIAKVDLPSSPVVWMCGDLHLENFGSFKGDNRLVYFDLNDCDEGVLGAASWEVARFITSIFTGFDSLGIEEKKVVKYAKEFLKIYSEILAGGKSRYIEVETAHGIVRNFLKKVEMRTQMELLLERVDLKKKRFLVIKDGKYIRLEKSFRNELMDYLNTWASKREDSFGNCKVHDVCFRVAGTGSLGVKRYVFLLESIKNKKRFRLLDMKQSRPSCLLPYAKIAQPGWSTEAERVLAIKRRLQNVSPAFLDTIVFEGESYLLQELQPSEDKIDFYDIRKQNENIEEVIGDMALLTASAQLRSTGRQGSGIADDLIAFGSDERWHGHMLEFARQYSRQVKKDYNDFASDYKNGFFGNTESGSSQKKKK